jgi:hypothetical protein
VHRQISADIVAVSPIGAGAHEIVGVNGLRNLAGSISPDPDIWCVMPGKIKRDGVYPLIGWGWFRI